MFRDGPILTGAGDIRICSFFWSFSRTKWGALTCYGRFDEQCSTQRADVFGVVVGRVNDVPC